MNKGAELDKQIYKEGEPTWGCKDGWLDVEDVKKCFDDIKMRMLKKFGISGGMAVIKIIEEETGCNLI